MDRGVEPALLPWRTLWGQLGYGRQESWDSADLVSTLPRGWVTLAKQTWEVSIHAGASRCFSVLSHGFSFVMILLLYGQRSLEGYSPSSQKRPKWATEHALTLFSYAERLEVEPELRCVSNPGQEGTEAGLREREIKLCNWMTNNHTKLPIPFGNVCSALLCTAQTLSLQVSDECHTVFLPSRSKCMSDWASECGGPKWRKWGFSLLQISVKKMLTIVKRKWIWS